MSKRRGLVKKLECQSWVVRFRHPLRDNKVVRVNLGDNRLAAEKYVEQLNAILTNQDNWHELPPKTLKLVRDAWTPAVRLLGSGKRPRRGGKVIDVDSETVAALQAELDHWQGEALRLGEMNERLEKELEQYRGRTRKGPCPTLVQAKKKLLKGVRGTSSRHQRNINCDLGLFIKEFGENTEVDELRERESDIQAWLRSLGLSAGRRQQVRIYVLKLLEDSGVKIDRKKVPAPRAKEIKKDRGPIRWLERHEAEALADKLPERHQDAFHVQVAIGLRPEELLSIRRENFSSDYSILTLEPFEHLGLKTGTRSLKIPKDLREIFKRRFKHNSILFPDPKTGKAWSSARNYTQQFNRALKVAAKASNVETRIDCRTGRRTCASLLIRDGMSVEQVATLLGDRPGTIRMHYAALNASEIDSSAAVLKQKKKN